MAEDGGKTNNYKYDTLTNTYTRLTNIPYEFRYGTSTKVGTDIYLFSTDLNSSDYYNNYKYDTLTDTWTKMKNIPYGPSGGCSSVSVGTSIYLFGGSNSGSTNNYKYDTLTDTWTKMKNIPYSYKMGSVAVIGTDIYILGGSDTGYNNYKYDTLTDTYTQLVNIPYNFARGGAVAVNTGIYVFGGTGGTKNARRFNTESKSYETDNSVVIAQGRTYDIGYNTKLFNTEFESDFQPLYGFADVYFYTTQNGLDGSMPVYYGDGTQWINIKNPPQVQNNE